MKKSKVFIVSLIASAVLSGCNTTQRSVNLEKSYLSKNAAIESQNKSEAGVADVAERLATKGLIYLPSLKTEESQSSSEQDLSAMFSATDTVSLLVDTLTVKDYLHYVFGELLGVNYILGDGLQISNDKITLNFQKEISKKELFEASRELLSSRNIALKHNNGVFYIHEVEAGAAGNLVYGYGNKPSDVPVTNLDIVQIAPFDAGVVSSMGNTIRQLTGVDTRPLFEQNALLIKGKRSEILKALDFMKIMDQPVFRNRSVGLYKSEFLPAKELSENLQNLLKQEGISVSPQGSNEQAISIVTIERTNTLVFFSTQKSFLTRIDFWASQLDKPADGNEKQFFVFEPVYARALDLGSSIQMLFGGAGLSASTSARNESNAKTSDSQSNQVSSGQSISVTAENLKMVVDERSNSLIFETTGEKYRALLPLIKRLDILPKQVVLEVMIAEVKLTDVFKQGVSFALTNLGADITGGFKVLSNAKDGFNYTLKGTAGDLAVSLLETNTNVNVLSRPTLAVRDGVAASIAVGDKIPIVGQIVTDPVNGSRTSVEYMDTGIDLTVTPTVNAQGVVLMEIKQKISTQAPGGAGVNGNPTLLDRTLSTEVIAGNGQTILLGGLIDEKSTLNDSRVPFFSSIPLLGKLFDGSDNNTVKTELVVLVTPRIVNTIDAWDEVTKEFKSALSNFNVN